jgi:copper chaperone
MQTQTLKVEGMSCSHCQMAVSRALRGVAGVHSAEVDLDRGLATVAFDPQIVDLARLATAVDDAGYTLVLPDG